VKHNTYTAKGYPENTLQLTGDLKWGNYCMLSPITEHWYQTNRLKQINKNIMVEELFQTSF